ncbi:hypothetical protein DFJ74DRAFT_385264 [Hyaloraphidium curvatum]|nr:hypothetical protein DFJ74DRAFT_385264 [Hyaloraphidium curvatum]
MLSADGVGASADTLLRGLPPAEPALSPATPSPTTAHSGASRSTDASDVTALAAVLGNISLVTDRPEKSAVGGLGGSGDLRARKGADTGAGGAASEGKAAPLAELAARADRLRIWGRVAAAERLDALARSLPRGPETMAADDMLLRLAPDVDPADDSDGIKVPDFGPPEGASFPSAAWELPDLSGHASSAFPMVPVEDTPDLQALFRDDDTQIGEDIEAAAEAERARAQGWLRRWNEGKPWSDSWIRDVSDAMYRPADPLSLAPALARLVHTLHGSRPFRRFLPPPMLVSQVLFALGPAGSSWLFPDPGPDAEPGDAPLVCRDAALLDLSEAAVNNCLHEIGEDLAAVRLVRSWTSRLSSPAYARRSSPTVHAFLSALASLISASDLRLAELDLRFRKHPEEVPTLLGLLADLRPRLAPFRTLRPLLDLLDDAQHGDPAKQAASLLAALFRGIEDNRLSWPARTEEAWHELFVEAAGPTIEWLSGWLSGADFEGGYFVRRDPDPLAPTGFTYILDAPLVPTFLPADQLEELLSAGSSAQLLRALGKPPASFRIPPQLPAPGPGPYSRALAAHIRLHAGAPALSTRRELWSVLQAEGAPAALELFWSVGLAADPAWRSALLDAAGDRDPAAWRSEAHLNRVLAAYLPPGPVSVRMRMTPSDATGTGAWDGVYPEFRASAAVGAALRSEGGDWRRVGSFVMQMACAHRLALDAGWLRLREAGDASSSSGQVVRRLRACVRQALLAVTGAMCGHFLGTVIAPQLDEIRAVLRLPDPPEDLAAQHAKALSTISYRCLMSSRASNVRKDLFKLLDTANTYAEFCGHYDSGTLSAISEPQWKLEAQQAVEDADDTASGMPFEELLERRRQRDVQRRRLADTNVLRMLMHVRSMLTTGCTELADVLEQFEAYGANFGTQGLSRALRGAVEGFGIADQWL